MALSKYNPTLSQLLSPPNFLPILELPENVKQQYINQFTQQIQLQNLHQMQSSNNSQMFVQGGGMGNSGTNLSVQKTPEMQQGPATPQQ
jgi:hypothetical protein